MLGTLVIENNIKKIMNLKLRHTLLFLNLLSTILIISGCENNIVAPMQSYNTLDTAKVYTHYLWPSKKGNWWNYNYYTFSFGNNDTNWIYKNFNSFDFNFDTVNITNIYKREVIETTNIIFNDTLYPCHIIASYINDQNTNFNKIFWIGKDGVYSMGAFNENGDTLLNKDIYILKNFI